MKNIAQWKPSKFTYKRGKLRASKDLKEVVAGSRLAANTIAKYYESHIPQYTKGKLLDLGCGKVPLFNFYKDLISENICVDWGNSLHRNPHLDIEHDLNNPLPLKDSEFDTIILSDVLEHIWKPDRLWIEMNRILKPGGKLLLNVPYYYCIHEEPYDYFRYTKYALTQFANDSGFSILVLRSTGGVPEIMVDLLAKTASRIPLIGKSLSALIQSTFFILQKTIVLKTLSKKSEEKFPFGYFMVAEKKSTR